jgi:hypothetical protein
MDCNNCRDGICLNADRPTEPGIMVEGYRYVRKYDAELEALVFAPIVGPQTYTARRPGRRRRELRTAITQCIVMLNIGAMILLAFLTYILDFS